MTINHELVTRKLLLVISDLEPLGAIAAQGRSACSASEVNQAVVERRLQRAIGRMIDINYHLLTASGHAPPADYHASFVALADMGLLDREFVARVARAAGLGNRFVHDYDDLDPALVFEALEAALLDIPRYLAAVNDGAKAIRRDPRRR